MENKKKRGKGQNIGDVGTTCNRPEVSASALQLGIEKWGGGGCKGTTAKQTEAREYHKNNTLVRNNEKK